MKITREFIEKIPKTDLHLHLDGSIRLSTLIELAQENDIPLPAHSEKELKAKVFKNKYQNLEEYLQGFTYTGAVLQSESALERVSYELAMDNIAEGVRYIEIRFAPQLHQHKHMGIINVLKAVNRGLFMAAEEFNITPNVQSGKDINFAYGIIVCAMRMFDYGFSEYFDALLDVHKHSERKWIFSLASQELVKASVEARDRFKIPIVGFDLAGQEKGYPAVDHKPAYALAHKNFLKKTVHAGEAFGPESIFQAITELNADRIGHGVHLFNTQMIYNEEIEDKQAYVENLAQYIGDRRITMEVCLTSNMQTIPEFKELKDHSFGKMREYGLSVTLCTDNRLVSSTTVTNEILKAVETFDIAPKELKNLIAYGFKRSFYPGTYLEKRNYVRKVLDVFEAVEKQFE
ncbi:MAG: adenosine deaminase family protein [Candidatus Aminicenantes bacterium]|nr:adenosine deaminase family protein [Candidatus Aminicenantes bacterium]